MGLPGVACADSLLHGNSHAPPVLEASLVHAFHVCLQAGAAPLLLQLMQPGASSGCQEAAARGFGNLVSLP
jgi:hypothetical protein